MPPTYRYKPLQHEDSIRILELNPSPYETDPIVCVLHHVQLSDPTIEYETISYTWGDPTPRELIYIDSDERELLVSENCSNVLKRLRLTDQKMLVWIDAICIDQSNLDERSSQVRIMDKIYDQGSTVTVYLGESTPGSRILFEELAAADRVLQDNDNCDRPLPNEIVVRELDALFTRPWFQRVWVLQEVCMRGNVTLMCGKDRATSSALTSCLFGYEDWVRVTLSDEPQALTLIEMAPEKHSTPQFDLWYLLLMTRSCLATDPRDRIFALSSLMGSHKSEVDALVDYTKDIEDTFVETTLFLLPVLGLQLLLAARHEHALDMPSWIPDWSQNFALLDYWAKQEDAVDKDTKNKYSLRSSTKRKCSRCLELVVTGHKYARIINKSQRFIFTNLDDARVQKTRLYNSIDSLKEFLVVNDLEDDDTMHQALGSDIVEAMSNYEGYNLHRSLYRRSGLLRNEDGEEEDVGNVQDFYNSLQQCSIALMDNGDLVLAGGTVKCGDAICVLPGTITPCALRQCDDEQETWRLISGDCFILTKEVSPTRYVGSLLCDDNLQRIGDENFEEFVIH